jgi:hypothetical protein
LQAYFKVFSFSFQPREVNQIQFSECNVDECGNMTKKRVSAGVEKLDETVTIIVEQVEPGELLYREHVLIATG